MKAFLINGKLDAALTEIETPSPAADEVRIKIAFVGICGSDLHYYYEGANGAFVVKEPLIPGHELSGTIDAEIDPATGLHQRYERQVRKMLCRCIECSTKSI